MKLDSLNQTRRETRSIQPEHACGQPEPKVQLLCGGAVSLTVYPVFPGIEIRYIDAHTSSCCLPRSGGKIMEITHCREGRIEYHSGESYYFLAPGDLSVAWEESLTGPALFPTGHYHGITVALDPARSPDCLSCFLSDVNVGVGTLGDRFLGDTSYFACRSSSGVRHIFSELYSVPESIRKGYFKVKILELLLFLSAFPLEGEPRRRGYSNGQVQLAKEVEAYLLANRDGKCTSEALAARFCVSTSALQQSFRGVYGMSPAAFLRAQKMHGAAELLRKTDRTVLDIAGEFGYDNPSKFARAFRAVIGVSPNAYRCGMERDSCAPAVTGGQ